MLALPLGGFTSPGPGSHHLRLCSHFESFNQIFKKCFIQHPQLFSDNALSEFPSVSGSHEMTLILLLKLLGRKKELENSLLGQPSWPQGPHHVWPPCRPPFPRRREVLGCFDVGSGDWVAWPSQALDAIIPVLLGAQVMGQPGLRGVSRLCEGGLEMLSPPFPPYRRIVPGFLEKTEVPSPRKH